MKPTAFTNLLPTSLRAQWVADGSYPQQAMFDLFCQQLARQPEAQAVLTPETSLSYQELHQYSLRLAHGLRQLGVEAGVVVASQLQNGWQACALDLALAALGAVVAPLPPGRGKLDLLALLKRSQAAVFVASGTETPAMLEETLTERATALPHLQELVHLHGDAPCAPGWHAMSSLFAQSPLTDLPKVDPDSALRLLVSSGTEAEPKLVAYSHNALAGGRGRFLRRLQGDGAPMRALFLVPLGSSFGSLASFGVLSCLGGSLLLLPRFEVETALQAIAQMRPSHILGVPTMLQRMAADPMLASIDTSSLQALVSGGALIAPEAVSRCSQAFACPVVSLYGSADGVNCHTMPADTLVRVQHSVGKPNPAICEIRIVDEHRRSLPTGEIGEIAARGPISPMQYVHAPELDARYRDAEGWVYTGDLGLLDAEGYLILAGRKKDIIIRGGINISPAQIENLISAHPQVVSAACVPVPDADLGQRVALCVTVADGHSGNINLTHINAFLQERGLEKNKLPQHLRLYPQLPLTPAGKIDKRLLAQDMATEARC